MTLKIYDQEFAHSLRYHGHDSTSVCRNSDPIIWNRIFSEVTDEEFVVFTDNKLHLVKNSNGVKVALLMEPPELSEAPYNYIKHNYQDFDIIFTYDKRLLDLNIDKFIYYPFAGCWIQDSDLGIHIKTKLCSTIMSNKNRTKSHQFRHYLKNSGILKNVDIYGSGGTISIPNQTDKIKALKDYAFSVTIDFRVDDYGFSEKLIDCFATGTIPIYYGAFNDAARHFNIDGIIFFRSFEELSKILSNLSLELYQSKLDAIIDNFHRAKKFFKIEDWIYEKLQNFQR